MSVAVSHMSTDRSWRMPAVILVAAALASTAPLTVLLIGPLVLGVPHVVGDLRVLWLGRPGGFGGQAAWLTATALLAMTVLRGATMADGVPRLQYELLCGLAAVAVAAWAGATTPRRRAAMVLPLLVAAWSCWRFPRECVLALAHGHNAVALVLWIVWNRSRSESLGVAGTYVLSAAWVVFVSDASVVGAVLGGLDGTQMHRELAPSLSVDLADAVVRSFAFAQLVHYGIWSWNLPGGTRWELRSHLGKTALGACVFVALAVPLLGSIAPAETRQAYLQAVLAHGWLELAVAAYLLAKGARP